MSGTMQGRGVRIDTHLTNILLNYQPTGWIADKLFPVVGVPKQSGVIPSMNQADLFRRENTKRSPGTEAHIVDYSVNSTNYYCQNYALKGNLFVEDKANADAIWIAQMESGRTTRVMDSLLLDWEVRVASQVTTAANVGTSTAISSAWTDLTNSDPLADCNTLLDNLSDANGYKMNRMVFSNLAWRNFSRNLNVINKVNQAGVSGGAENATVAQAAALLEVEDVLVGRSYYNTAEEGQAQTLVNVWGDEVLAYYAPAAPSVEQPSFGYSFRWQAPGIANMQAERHAFDAKRKSEEVEIGYYQDELITAAALGGLLTNVTSSN